MQEEVHPSAGGTGQRLGEGGTDASGTAMLAVAEQVFGIPFPADARDALAISWSGEPSRFLKPLRAAATDRNQ